MKTLTINTNKENALKLYASFADRILNLMIWTASLIFVASSNLEGISYEGRIYFIFASAILQGLFAKDIYNEPKGGFFYEVARALTLMTALFSWIAVGILANSI